MIAINFRLMFQPLMFKTWTGRSVQASALILILATTSVSPVLAQSQPLTWQNALSRLFGRQPQKGGTRGPTFCSVTPMTFRGIPRSEGARTFNSVSQRLLTDKPLIAWYGNVSSLKIRNRTTKTEQLISLPTLIKPEAKELPDSNQKVLHQVQYDGEALLPGQDYELVFMSPKDPDPKKDFVTVIESYRFRTLSQADRNVMTLQLKRLADTAAKTNSDPILPQVEFLLQQNLVNDAQMLILQQSNPSPELAAAITTVRNPCEIKFKPKVLQTPSPTTPSPTTPSPNP